jgi:starch synthase
VGNTFDPWDKRLKIWLPYTCSGSGADVFIERLTEGLSAQGHETIAQPLSKFWQYFPWRLKAVTPPRGTQVTLTNLNIAFALKRKGIPLVAVEHHCVLDPAYTPYRSLAQAIYHEALLRRYDLDSLGTADAVVAVSEYTAASLHQALGGPKAQVILNGIEIDFFCPQPKQITDRSHEPFQLLYVGNLLHRKGTDLLPKIMQSLGSKFELHYTSGLRTSNDFAGHSNIKPLGRLSRDQLRNSYRKADILLFPTRFEGFGYAAAEAMACGTPVVSTDCSSLPELVDDEVNGVLCPIDDVDTFVTSIQTLAANPDRVAIMGNNAREKAISCFSIDRMARAYGDLFQDLAQVQTI